MNIERINEELSKVINELNDTTIEQVHGKRVFNFKKAERDFYNGADNAEELRNLKQKLDRNTDLMDNRELRKNYEGRYLKVEYDDDEQVYNTDLQSELTENDEYYNIWIYGGDKHPLEYDANGNSIMFNYVGIWNPTFKDDEIIKKAQEEWGKELIPDNIKVVWDGDSI